MSAKVMLKPQISWQKGLLAKSKDGTANAATSHTIAAATGMKHRVYGYSVKVSGAESVSLITITLTDEATVMWKDFIPAATKIGEGVAVMFPAPIQSVAANKEMIFAASAGGTAVITHINLLYDTIPE